MFLTEEQTAFVDSARDFAKNELAPHAAHWDAEKIFPKEVLAKAAQMGFMGLYAPESAGGMGLSRFDSALVFEELAQGCTSTTAYITIHNMVTWMIGTWGTPRAIEQYAQGMAAGQLLGSYCLTEAGAGSDAASLRTRAVPTTGGYHVSGTKMFISGAGSTDVLVVMARIGAQELGARGISAFVIPANSPGITYGKNEDKLGWNSQPTRAITFDNVFVPTESLLGKEGEGFKFAMKGLDGGRINIAACSLGAAQATLDQARTYTQERKQFKQAIADFQATQFKLADMLTELVAARQMVHLASRKLDAGDADASAYCAMAKRFATDMGFNVCNQALQLHGGYGYIREYPIERFMRDARVHQILEGTNEVMRVIIARHYLEKNHQLR